MSGQGAEAVLYDIDGDAMAVENGTAIPPLTSSLISAGSDGTNARFIKVTSDGYQLIVGVGSPGVPYGGIITIQGDPLGTPIPISGNITASNASVSANDGAIPGFSTLIGGSDGTNLRPARIFDLDTGGGTQWILGVGLRKASGGGSVELGTSSDPIRTDPTGTTTQPISGTVTANQGGSWTVSGTGDFTVVQPTASNLRAQLASETTIGIAIPSTAVQVGGSDGVNLRPIFLDSSGRQIIIGAAANGAAVAGNPVLVAGSDGTNARSIRTATDGTVRVDPTGTTIQPVSGTVTANQGTSPWVENVSQFGGSNVVTGTGTSGAGIPRVTVSNDSNILATQSGTWTVEQGTPPWSINQTQINGSAVTTLVAGEQKVAVEGLAADGASPSGNPVLMAGQDGTNVQSIFTDPRGDQYIVNYGAPSDSLRGLSFGRVTGSANTLQAVRATAYSQPTANAQRSVSSTSANDTSAGTGARQIRITYYTATMTGPFTETITLNGTTPVNTSNTNICFIERMEVMSIGSTGSNIGIITLFGSTGGGGGLIGTIGINNIVNGRGDNHTLWAHHYVAAGVTANITSYACGSNGNQGNASFLMAVDPTVTTSPEKIISDALATSASTLSVVRNLIVPIRISGPSRITLFIVPLGSNTNFFGGFDFWEL